MKDQNFLKVQRKIINIGAWLMLILLFYDALSNYLSRPRKNDNHYTSGVYSTKILSQKEEERTWLERIATKILDYKRGQPIEVKQTMKPSIGDTINIECKAITYDFSWCHSHMQLTINADYQHDIIPSSVVKEISQLSLEKETRLGIPGGNLGLQGARQIICSSLIFIFPRSISNE